MGFNASFSLKLPFQRGASSNNFRILDQILQTSSSGGRAPASMQCNWVAASEFAKVCIWSHFETPVTQEQVWKPP